MLQQEADGTWCHGFKLFLLYQQIKSIINNNFNELLNKLEQQIQS